MLCLLFFGEVVMEKIRTTIYIDRKLMELARIEVDNLSELMTNLLSHYLSTNSTVEIDKKIKELKEKVQMLEIKKADMIRNGLSEDRREGMNENLLEELKDVYAKRRKQLGDNRWADEQWIMSPKNIQKAKFIGKEPLELMVELRNWYDKQN